MKYDLSSWYYEDIHSSGKGQQVNREKTFYEINKETDINNGDGWLYIILEKSQDCVSIGESNIIDLRIVL